VANLNALAGDLIKNTKMLKPLNPFGLADRFAERYENQIYKIKKSKNFAIWNGKHFEIAPSEMLMINVRRLIEGLPYEIENLKFAVTTDGDFVTCEDYLKFKNNMSKLSAIEQTIKLLLTCSNFVKEDSDFDRDTNNLVAQNGIIDLKTSVLRDHDQSFLSTRIAPVPYTPEATCDNFIKFLDKITCDRQELARFIQVLCGYLFSGVTREQEIYIFHGFGSNGKSTFLNLLLKAAGLYGFQTPASTLMKKSSKSSSDDLASAKRARVVIASETNEGEKLDEARIKIMSGGDPIVCRLLFENLETYFAQYKVILAVNTLPEIMGCNYGTFRRIVVVPFDKVFKDAERDKFIYDELEKELPGIFAWIVEGAKEYFDNGLPRCQVVQAATQRYVRDLDRVESFLNDECIIDRGNDKFRIALPDLYNMSNTWNDNCNREPFKKKILTDMLLRKGFKQGKSGSMRQWIGIKPKIKGI
jgi:P4 family phage/plasmid primase-like protien